MDISVIVCTHNPKARSLERTLQSLRAQTLSLDEWEMVIIDNASATPVAGMFDLSWHRRANIIVESELGLTPARVRGIRDSSGKLLVFVDDDNLLAPDYLSQALAIHHQMAWLGAWGGNIEGEFEIPPPEFAKDHLHYLALRDVPSAKWAYDAGMGALPFTPCGVGMCLTREVATAYLKRLESDPRLGGLDRKGASLVSCGDTDMALTACDIGLAVGVFPQLKMRHLIPASRLDRDYLRKLVIGVDTSSEVLRKLRCGGDARKVRSPRLFQDMVARASRAWRKWNGTWTGVDQFRWEIQTAKHGKNSTRN